MAAMAAGFVVQVAGAEEAAREPAANGGPQRVLVLQDGGVLTGRIARDGDMYVVSRSGGELRIGAGKVLLECGSLEEAYARRRAELRPTAAAHLALAEWCLRYDLVEQAHREFNEAQALDAEHPRLPLVARRLEHARQAPLQPPAAETAIPANATDGAAAEVPPSTLGEVPAGVLERFTRKVQPVLVNNCTAAGCHQPGGAQQFQLDRSLLHGMANRRTTMRNLAATLELVDRERPQLSALLTVPRQAHGGMEEPIFGPRQGPAFEHLVAWVAIVTKAKPAEAATPATADEPVGADQRDIVGQFARGPIASGTGIAGMAPSEQPNEELTTPATPRLRFGAPLEKWHPRDEFDPEIFNRRHARRERMAATGEPPAEDAAP
jgi:hypothetical protein